jgi:hypothetical protein
VNEGEKKRFMSFTDIVIRVGLFMVGGAVWLAFNGQFVIAGLLAVIVGCTFMGLWRHGVNHGIDLRDRYRQ